MGRISSATSYALGRASYAWGKAVDIAIALSPVGEARRAYEAGASTLEFDWSNTWADTWTNSITSSGQWTVESIEHPFEWDVEKDEPKPVVRVTFARVEPGDGDSSS